VQLPTRASESTAGDLILECFPGFDGVTAGEFLELPVAGLGSSFSEGCQGVAIDIDLRASVSFSTTIGWEEGLLCTLFPFLKDLVIRGDTETVTEPFGIFPPPAVLQRNPPSLL
jgi:hypothetical protein